MEHNPIIEKISDHYRKKLPFVMYALPENDELHIYLQKDNTLHTIEEFSKQVFVFAPFDFSETAFCIPEENCEIFQTTIEKQKFGSKVKKLARSVSEKNKYLKLFNKTHEAIKQRKATKIVISRFKDIKVTNFNLEELIKQLFSLNQAVFRYIWYHPETGLWCGATPEILVYTNEHSFTTMALAATQQYNGSMHVLWSPKEIDEQQLVTDSITNSLQKVTSVLKVSNSHTHRAGSLLHLKTNITGILKSGKTTITTIAAALHPTPAVCGTPQKFAKEFIKQNEGYPREFYTGFLGPIKTKHDPSWLMVNLRCMKIEENIARIYAGGGITIGSNPEEEWQETQNKMQTMLQVLHPML